MAVVIIDDLNEVEDVFELMTYLARALESGHVERLLEEGTITLTKGPGPSANQVADIVRFRPICMPSGQVMQPGIPRKGCQLSSRGRTDVSPHGRAVTHLMLAPTRI